MVGAAPRFLAMLEQVRRIAGAIAPVLIEGETGSGKELAARAIHYLSARRDQPFVPLNCGAIPDNLVESELFGHVRGAFTDAKQARFGVVTQANGGTLFLDEVDSLSLKAQVALLRFLQDHRYRPVGHDRDQVSDARIIAASNRSLKELVGRGEFRGDLLYRLDILSLRIPPLRERAEDIETLARHYIARFCEQYNLARKSLHPATLHWMKAHHWPGNVRELENLMHRFVLLADGREIVFSSSDVDGGTPTELRSLGHAPGDGLSYPAFHSAKALAIAEFEHRYLVHLLEETSGNVSAAARLAGKERRSLGKLLKKYDIGTQQFRS
ncbi:sigma-54 dependent transcriptional regulator [Hydrocarboniphaga sp.]|uniref:sigma-54 interaction domain-containing protein n=1 Tax=Hydrocarboniphaga sp. TaxID=2033016 RepID=UPI002607C35A|nr:sigma-54 dependent transcriptional regulator [Hydrocarboniphaga sp.]